MRVALRDPLASTGAPSSDADDLRAVLAKDQAAWRRFVRRHADALREVVKEILEPIAARNTTAEVDDVMGAFWLRMVDDDMRWLRAFNPARGGSLLQWLTMHASQLAHERARELRRERKRRVPIDEAGPLAAGAPLLSPPARSGNTIDYAIREAVRDVVREEIQIALRELTGSLTAQPAHSPGEYLSIADAAEIAKVHPATLRSWIRDGRLRGYRAGRHHRIKRSELDACLASLGDAPDFDLDARARDLARR